LLSAGHHTAPHELADGVAYVLVIAAKAVHPPHHKHVAGLGVGGRKEEPPMSAAHKSALAVRAATGVESRIVDERDCTGVSASAAMSAVVLLPHGLLGSLVALVLIIFGRTQNDLAYAGTVGDWQRLEDHVEAIARLVRKRCADWEPEVVLSKLPPTLIQ
jgi:hypothetical protein